MLKNLYFAFALITLGGCQCPDGYTYIKNRCFKAYNYLTSAWPDAQNLCENDQNGYLAIIDDCSLLGDLAVYFHMSGIESTVGYWIGATDMEVEENWWIWTDTDKTNVTLGVPFWASVQNGSSANWFLEPSGGVNENCALLSPSDQYFFRDEDCKRSANPLCQTDVIEFKDDKQRIQLRYDRKREETEATYCTDGFDFVNEQCFLIQPDVILVWNEAREYCHNRSSELVILKDCDLFGILVKFILDNHPLLIEQSYWIGASDKGDEGAWYWVDNTPVRLGSPFWGQYNGVNKPNENTGANCLNLYASDSYYFHDGGCDYKSRFICQKDPVSVP